MFLVTSDPEKIFRPASVAIFGYSDQKGPVGNALVAALATSSVSVVTNAFLLRRFKLKMQRSPMEKLIQPIRR